jgi:hypothetical protein
MQLVQVELSEHAPQLAVTEEQEEQELLSK